jgi:hypothetical protein
MSEFTPERIVELRKLAYFKTPNCSDGLEAALTEIERLQARGAELKENRDREVRIYARQLAAARDKNQRREKLLRECLEFVQRIGNYSDKPMDPEPDELAAALLAELGDQT